MAEKLEDYALSKKVGQSGTLQKVGVIGCGNMGQEVVRMISQFGIDVVFIELSKEQVEKAFIGLDEQLDDLINKWGLTESEKRAILSRIQGSTDYSDIADCDLVIETINIKQRGTSLDTRKEVFRKIESVVSRETVIATNNSTLMLSDLASVLRYPDRAVGLHFISPASAVKIVEVIRGVRTSDLAFDFAIRFAKMIEKRVIVLNETPGNISTRLIVPLINEACELLMEGVASVQCIDMTMKLGYGLQFGPFELADRVGIDKVLKWMDNLYQEFGLQQFKASPIIKRMVRVHYLGKKVGKGFYHYKEGKIVSQAISATEFKSEPIAKFT